MNGRSLKRGWLAGLLLLLAASCTPNVNPAATPTPPPLLPATAAMTATSTLLPGAILPTPGPVMPDPATATPPPLLPVTPTDALAGDLPPALPTAVSPMPESGTQLLQQRQSFTSRLDLPGEIDRYAIFGESGSTITIGMSAPPGSDFIPYFDLYSPSGELLVQSVVLPGTTSAAAIGIVLPSTGAYILFARDARNQATGEYTLTYGSGLTFLDRVQSQTAPEAVYTGALNQPGTRDTWTLDLVLGDVISAAAVSADNLFDPVLELVAPDGQVIRLDDNGGGGVNAAIRQAIAPQTGRYVLGVSAAAGSPPGGYTLVWRYDGRAPTPTPAP